MVIFFKLSITSTFLFAVRIEEILLYSISSALMVIFFKLSITSTFLFAVRIEEILLYSISSAKISVNLSIIALPPLGAFNKVPFSSVSISGVSK